jgi:DNA replication protein DnaC
VSATDQTLDSVDLDAVFKRLHLANARRIWKELVDRAEREDWTFEQFLKTLVAEEVAHRANTRVERLRVKAELPFFKTADDFNFSMQSALRMTLFGSFLSPDFVTEGRSLILSGKTGRGKTHLAVAVAYRAIQNGFTALFTTCAALIDDLSAASHHKRGFKEALLRYTSPDVLIVDEVGYLAVGNDAANVLFHVVNERYLKHRAMVFTTNKPLEAWGALLHDDDLAEVILDRVLERGRHIRLDGPSGRTQHLGPEAPPAQVGSRLRVSGIRGSEFPEPTTKAIAFDWVAAAKETTHRSS